MSRRREALERTLERAKSTRGLALMGVCNVTPDSFSDGGLHFSPEAARARVDELMAEGADIIDIGGESTRPRAEPVPAAGQIGRVLDVVRYSAGRGACVSIDTTSPEVAAAALDAGASVVNDVSCLLDGALARVVAASGAALVLMHARGTQTEMPGFSTYADDAYADVVRDVCAEWEVAADRARAAGVPRDAILMDPGFGFAKNARHSLELLSRLDEVVRAVGVRVVVGASRKSFLAASSKETDPACTPRERLGASIAAALHAYRAGASVIRVHDVRATRQAIDLERSLAAPVAAPYERKGGA
ncbi:MAG TPA: dihydropteroate synthase [Polyangiaceae bacterium]|nr:dihydropteroate synthase [Polyangiaceae bacterium]